MASPDWERRLPWRAVTVAKAASPLQNEKINTNVGDWNVQVGQARPLPVKKAIYRPSARYRAKNASGSSGNCPRTSRHPPRSRQKDQMRAGEKLLPCRRYGFVSSISSEELRSIAGRKRSHDQQADCNCTQSNCKISATHLLHALQYSNTPLVGVSQRFPTLGSAKVHNGDGQDAGADKAKPPLRIAKSEQCTGYAGSKQDERDRKQDHLFKSAELLRSQHKARAVFQKKRPTSNTQRSIIQHPES